MPGISLQASDVEYVPLPPAAKPFQDETSSKALLTPPTSGPQTQVDIGFDSRAVNITRAQPGTTTPPSDSIPLWTTHYAELSDYLADMQAQSQRKTAQSNWADRPVLADSAVKDPTRFELPVKVPDWARKLGVSKPSLSLTGSYTLALKVRSQWSSLDEENGTANRVPDFSPEQIPNINLTGNVGRLISVSLSWNEEGFGASKSQLLQVRYAGEKPEDTEDDILQEAEFGQVALNLPGSTLTGYSYAATGLIGLRTRMKFGDLDLTVVGGAEQGERQRQKLGVSATSNTTTFDDKSIETVPKDFWLDSTFAKGFSPTAPTSQLPAQPANLRVFQRITVDQKKTRPQWGPFYTGRAAPYDERNLPIEQWATPDNEIWRELGTKDWYWDRGVLRISTRGEATDEAIGVKYNNKGSVLEERVNLVLLRDISREIPSLRPLQLRNRYYKLPVVAASERPNVKIRILDGSTRSDNSIDTATRKEWVRVLGLVDDATGKLRYDDVNIFDWDRGVLTFPDLEPFRKYGRGDLYDSSLAAIDRGIIPAQFKIEVTAKGKSDKIKISNGGSSSVSGSNCFDIQEGSEVLTLNGSTRLEKGVDYEVSYKEGSIYLLSNRARDPAADIQVDFGCTPFFSLESRTLAGARLEYQLPGNKESLLGATLLYRSETVTDPRAQLGREPNSAWLWGANLRLAGESELVTNLVDRIPFIAAAKESRWKFELEGAQSYNNPNTTNSAVVDDFEAASDENVFPINRTSWYKASPPSGMIKRGPTAQTSTYFPDRSWERQADFTWSSNAQVALRDIYPNYSDGNATPARENVLQMHIKQNSYGSGGRAWGGIMRSFSQAGSDNRLARTLEVVARGSGGILLLDFGRISEDLSINGGKPNGRLDGEDIDSNGIPTGTVRNDLGLDGLADVDEIDTAWDCYGASCSPREISRKVSQGAVLDPTGDNYRPDVESNDPGSTINGTEGNNRQADGGSGSYFDTEDLNRNGTLDVVNSFHRYAIRFGGSRPTPYTALKNGWRRYTISLDDSLQIVGNGADWSNLNSVRMTYTGIAAENGANQQEERLLLARVALVGSQWQGKERLTANDSVLVLDSTVTNSWVSRDTLWVRDSGSLKVGVVNRHENAATYLNYDVPVSKDPGTGAEYNEQSLRLQYINLRRDFGGALGAVKSDSGVVVRSFEEGRDLTLYKELVLQVFHLNREGYDRVGDGPVRLGVQWGSGSKDNPNSYYEYSFDPTTARCPLGDITCDSLEAKRRELMVKNWQENQIRIPLKGLATLKSERLDAGKRVDSIFKRVVRADERPALASSTRDDSIAVRGEPSLSKVEWMRIWVRSNPAPGAPRLNGEIWVNDFRVESPQKGLGTALRSSAQMNFSDLADVSTEVGFQEGDFVPMGQKLAALSSQKSTATLTATGTTYLSRFLPDSWKASLPFTVTARTDIERPWAIPGSDQELTRDGFPEIAKDFWNGELRRDSADLANRNSAAWENLKLTRSYSTNWSRGRDESGTMQAFVVNTLFARPKLAWKYTESENYAPSSRDTSGSHGLQFDYDFSPGKTPSWQPLKGIKSTLVPEFLRQTTIQPYPSSITTTLADLDFSETSTSQLDPYRDTALFLDSLHTQRVRRERSAGLRHAVNAEWQLLDWWRFSSSLSSDRAWNNYDEAGKFDPNHLWRASPLIFAVDTTRVRLPGSTDSTRQGYGFLRNENGRSFNWQFELNPQLVSFFTTSASYRTTATSNREAVQVQTVNNGNGGFDTLPIQFWRHDRQESFTGSLRFAPNDFLRSVGELGPKGWKSAMDDANSFLDRWRWSGLGLEYSVEGRVGGVRQTLDHSSSQENLDAAGLWRWQAGLGDQASWRTPVDLITGSRSRTGLGEYEPWRLYDPKVYTDPKFLTTGWGPRDGIGVDRSSQVSTRSYRLSSSTDVTVPGLQLQLSPSASYQVSWEEVYIRPWSVDTTRTWPQLTMGANWSNLVGRVPGLGRWFESVTASHSVGWEVRDEIHPHVRTSDSRTESWKFQPLLGLSFRTKGAWSFENRVNWSFGDGDNFNKEATDAENGGGVVGGCPDGGGFYTDPALAGVVDRCFQITSTSKTSNFEAGDELTASYRVQTQKGIQILRWFVKLDNDLTINFKAGYTTSWQKVKNTNALGEVDETRPSAVTKVYAGSSANYNFTPKLVATFDANFERNESKVANQTSPSTISYLIASTAQLQYRF